MRKYKLYANHSLPVEILEDQFENRKHGDSAFPCASYIDGYHGERDVYPWHWHEELELAYVTQGECRVSVNDHTFLLREGEGCIINRRILHTYSGHGSTEAVLPNLLFHPALLYGTRDSVFWQNYVKKLVFSADFTHVVFSPSTTWQAQILDLSRSAYSLMEEKPYGFEFRVRAALSEILLLLLENRTAASKEPAQNQIEMDRLLNMMSFIHMHYAEPLQVKQIADSASISTRGCLRCFQNIIGTTPMQYVMDVRIQKAKHLLSESRLSILETASACGFQSESYFIKIFRERTGLTPAKFKKGL